MTKRMLAIGHSMGLRQKALGLRPGSLAGRYKLSKKQREYAKLYGHPTGQEKRNGRKPKTKK